LQQRRRFRGVAMTSGHVGYQLLADIEPVESLGAGIKGPLMVCVQRA
jgi:hypothetical protein